MVGADPGIIKLVFMLPDPAEVHPADSSARGAAMIQNSTNVFLFIVMSSGASDPRRLLVGFASVFTPFAQGISGPPNRVNQGFRKGRVHFST